MMVEKLAVHWVGKRAVSTVAMLDDLSLEWKLAVRKVDWKAERMAGLLAGMMVDQKVSLSVDLMAAEMVGV